MLKRVEVIKERDYVVVVAIGNEEIKGNKIVTVEEQVDSYIINNLKLNFDYTNIRFRNMRTRINAVWFNKDDINITVVINNR